MKEWVSTGGFGREMAHLKAGFNLSNCQGWADRCVPHSGDPGVLVYPKNNYSYMVDLDTSPWCP